MIYGRFSNLYAVATPNGRLCEECAEKKYGADLVDFPRNEDDCEDTIVVDADVWKHEIDGLCVGDGCANIVGIGYL